MTLFSIFYLDVCNTFNFTSKVKIQVQVARVIRSWKVPQISKPKITRKDCLHLKKIFFFLGKMFDNLKIFNGKTSGQLISGKNIKPQIINTRIMSATYILKIRKILKELVNFFCVLKICQGFKSKFTFFGSFNIYCLHIFYHSRYVLN